MRSRSVQRATAILKAIALNNKEGLRLVDLAERLPFDRTTVYRLVQSLVADSLVIQRENRRYYLGQALFELGLCAGQHFTTYDICPALKEIAANTGDTVFLHLRSDNETVCIDRKNGNFPIKVFTMEVGDRRPLGASSAGLAILSALPEEEAREVLNENTRAIARKNVRLTVASIWELVQQARSQGYALRQGDFIDTRSLAVPIIGNGKPIGAISVTGITSRITPDRHKDIVRHITKGVRAFERLLANSSLGSWLLKDADAAVAMRAATRTKPATGASLTH